MSGCFAARLLHANLDRGLPALVDLDFGCLDKGVHPSRGERAPSPRRGGASCFRVGAMSC